VRRRRLATPVLTGVAALLAACAPVPPPPPPPAPLAPPPPDISRPANAPTLTAATTFVTQTQTDANPADVAGIDHPWDIAFTPDGTTGLFTERFGRISQFDPVNGNAKVLGMVAGVQQSGESGLLGMAVDPQFATNHYIYVCASEGTNQIHRLTVDLTANPGQGLTADQLLLTGMPQNSFHDGCRVRFQPNTNPPALWITMGDAGIGPGPQSPGSLAGKILRTQVDNTNNQLNPYPGNPYISLPRPISLVYTFGHRNPQGITFQPGTNIPYNAEHGPTINDEVNRLVPAGGNAGWDPNTNGNYDQSHPMTDLAKFPDAIRPAWRSGDTFTLAPSGATFLSGTQWKDYNGALAVAFLKDSRMRVMLLNGDGSVRGAVKELELSQRLRSVVEGPNGNLYVSTDMGQPKDAIWQVVPS
jgi:glucose/arabinose dehydrogenase